MDRAISIILDKWFEQKQKGKDSPVTYRERSEKGIFYKIDRKDIYEFMDYIEYNLPKDFVISIRCHIDEESIYFDTADLKESLVFE